MYLRQELTEREGGAHLDISDGRELTDELIGGEDALNVIAYMHTMTEQHGQPVTLALNGYDGSFMVILASEYNAADEAASVLGRGNCAADALADAMDKRHEWLAAYEKGKRYLAK
jgi:hypothetical protein